ncbi:hypothetical protein O9H85_24715 [Paenibacillus filicis]|uniref:Uncharacterized protein n=1 Tax=Paenibacillus gyeongsangnamensis TaxID=3388067 RepID=A0ABT4QFB2_9BACL|nr:hypothetical protein [Paenibacillus filicis]MCZ8515551.1 hypothetical protein [Paenibacillus filicis]
MHSSIIEPTTYHVFENEAAQLEQCKEWNLLSEKASKAKVFFYKRNGLSLPCSIIGYVDKMTAVIELENKQLHCIHPSYLKEMQAANYGQRPAAAAEEAAETAGSEPVGAEPEGSATETPQEEASPAAEPVKLEAMEADAAGNQAEETAPEEPSPKGKAKKEKASKLQLPEDKVKMTATVKEFTTVPNNFSDNDDEVIIYEAVSILEPETEIGDAWSSNSATLKKLELEIGDKIAFEAKIVSKKLTRHPVPYKINNPSKIQKEPS